MLHCPQSHVDVPNLSLPISVLLSIVCAFFFQWSDLLRIEPIQLLYLSLEMALVLHQRTQL